MVDKSQIKELKNLIALCKREGIKSIEIAGMKLEFNPYSLPQKKSKTKEDDQIITENQYTDEEILFWSTGGLNG